MNIHSPVAGRVIHVTLNATGIENIPVSQHKFTLSIHFTKPHYSMNSVTTVVYTLKYVHQTYQAVVHIHRTCAVSKFIYIVQKA